LTPKILNKSSGFFLPALDHSVPGLGAVIGGAPGGLETSAGVSKALFFTGKFGVLSKVIARRPSLAMAPSSLSTHSNYESSSHARPPWQKFIPAVLGLHGLARAGHDFLRICADPGFDRL
jgi:hypothetical protein